MARSRQQVVVEALIGREPRAIWPQLPRSTQALLVAAWVAREDQLLDGKGCFKGSLVDYIGGLIGVGKSRAKDIALELGVQGLTIREAEAPTVSHVSQIFAKPVEVDQLRTVLQSYEDDIARPCRLTTREYTQLEVLAEALCVSQSHSGPRTAALAYALGRRREVILPRDMGPDPYSMLQPALLGEQRAVVNSQCIFDALTERTSSAEWSLLPKSTKALIAAAFIVTTPDRYYDKTGYLGSSIRIIAQSIFGMNDTTFLASASERMFRLGLLENKGKHGCPRVKVVPTVQLKPVLQDYALYCRDPGQLSPDVYAELEAQADQICATLSSDMAVGELAIMLAKLAGAAAP